VAVAHPRSHPAQPPDTVRGQIKFTEQGEVLFYRYNIWRTGDL